MDLKDELLDNLSDGDRQDEQAVIICLQFPIGKFENIKARDAINDLNIILRETVETSGVGIYDGYEFSSGPDEENVKFFMRGKDARDIYNEVKPILESLPSLSGFYIIKRYSSLINQFHLSS
jgi:hypothetical protein